MDLGGAARVGRPGLGGGPGTQLCPHRLSTPSPMQPTPDEAQRDRAGDSQWSRPECQAWTGTLLLGTCLLYCTRSSMPICTVSMSQDFGWNKKEAGIVLSSFFWGYCLTQVVGGHLGDR